MNGQSQKRVAVYIDGSNFYFKMKSPELHFKNLVKFNFRGLAEWLSRDRKIISCRYYIGVVRSKENDKRGQKLRRDQQKLFAHLKSPKQNFIIKKGYLMKNDGVYHEKGVDVELAVDLLVGAYENIYDTAILISSDNDLIPAIRKVKYLGKEVEYIGFAHQPTFGLQTVSTLSRLLIKEELEPYAFNNI
ncbi:MAG: NYN domain-containing protein [bacterium]